MKRALWMGALALLLLGCEEQKSDAPAGAASTKASGAAMAQVKDEDVPTAADFEEEAEKDITADNLDAELDKLDKEIGQ